MAKELPYFKFEPNQWENGNIQICTREDKGLFIDICSMYWSRIGNLPLKLVIQKLCAGNATALNSLIEESIIEVIDDYIYIHFLNEQLSGFKKISDKNSQNAKEGWEKRRKAKDLKTNNATALNSQSETDGIREEKIREDKRREDNITETKVSNEIDFDKLLKTFNSITGKKSRVVNSKTKSQFNARLKEGYTKQDVFKAIKNCYDDPYHRENPKFLTLEFISRSDKLDKYSNYQKSNTTNTITTTADDNR